MINAPDPTLLQTFVAIVESGSFTSAAKRVHRTQSAVSMQIRRLEAVVGHSLFERTGRNIRLTATGQVFYDYARRILQDYKSAMGALGQAPMEGELTVGAPDDYVTTFLPDVLASFMRAYPRVRIHVVSEPSKRLVYALSTRTVDIILVTEGEGSTGGAIVHREPLVWATSEQYPVHEHDPTPLAVFHSGDVFRRHAAGLLEEAGRHVSIALTSSSFSGIEAAIQSGVAVAAIFRGCLRPGMRVLTPEEGFPELPDIGLVVQKNDQESHDLADRFSSHIATVLGQRGLRGGADGGSRRARPGR